MEQKINLVELLKDCPNGMELYSPIYGVGLLTKVTNRIHVKFPKEHNVKCFRLDGKVSEDGEIMLFPKGKTTWDGFKPPCKFRSGDVLVSESGNIVLLSHIDSENIVHYHCIIPTYGSFRIEEKTNIGVGRYYECVLANEQQKQRMYDKIKSSGYIYNQHINKLEKLIESKFKVGDKIKDKNNREWFVVQVFKKHFDISSVPNAEGYFVPIEDQDKYELVPNKFDITTLKPFDKVLVRVTNDCVWMPKFFSHYDADLKTEHYPFITTDNLGYAQCIPYEGNEYLCRKTNDCDEYYKTWG